MVTRQITDNQIIRRTADVIERCLPADWSLDVLRDFPDGPARPDAVLKLTAPGGESVSFVAESKTSITSRSLDGALRQVGTLIAESGGDALPLIAADFIGRQAKQFLQERGVSYVDTTGNLRLSAARPGLFIEATGATRDPRPSAEPLQSLRGRGAGRAIRALVDIRPPFGVRELAARTQVSVATLSRVIGLLERDALLDTDERGAVINVDWSGIIRRWSQDYELRRSNSVMTYLEPRGLPALAEKLGQATFRYAATASLAAQRFAPIAPTRQAVVYVDDAIDAAKRLGLQPADVGANVLLVEPYDVVVFDRVVERDGLTLAAPTQIAVDLLTGPGREPSEGVELLDWMGRNEDAWRA